MLKSGKSKYTAMISSDNSHRITQYKSERNLTYVFIAYTAEQFQSSEDLRVLHQIADAAARNAGVMAYWIGCSCMPDPDQLQEDVSLPLAPCKMF